MARILIIDDEVDMCWALGNVLKSEGHTTFSAQDGPAGLKLLEEKNPELVLCDIRLPGMDGIEILRRIKTKFSKLPVIMITGYGNVDSAVEVMKMGAFDYISKPFENQEILSTVNRALGIKVLDEGGHERQKLGRKLKIRGLVGGNDAGPVETIKKLKMPLNKIRATFLALFILFIALALVKLAGRKTMEYGIPHAHISGILYDGSNIWTADWFAQNIFRYDVKDGLKVADKYHLPDVRPAGLAWDGQNLWLVDNWAKKIFKYSKGGNLSQLGSYGSPGMSPSAIAWDGNNLWTADSEADMIYKHRMDSTLSVEESYRSPSTNPSGLAWDGSNMWSCDADNNKIYKHDNDSGLSIMQVYELEEYGGNMSVMASFCWDGNNFWTCPEGAKKIYRHNYNRIRIKHLMGGN